MRQTWLTVRAERARRALRRDSGRVESDDTERQVELCRIMWWMRHLVLGAAATVGVLDGWNGRADLVVLAALAMDAANHRLVARRPHLVRRVIVADAVGLLAFTLLGLPFVVVLVLAVATLAWAATFRPFAAVSAYLGASASAWTAFALADDAPPLTPMIGFALLGTIFIVRMIRLNMGARRAAEREHIVAEGVDAIIWETIPDTPGALKVSPSVGRLLGYPAEAFEWPGFAAGLVHPDDSDLASLAWSGGGGESAEFRVRRSDGEYRWFESRTSVIGRVGGGDDLIVGVLTDRTDQIEVERNALTLGHLMASSPIGQIMLCRRDGTPVIEALNPASRAVLGIDGVPIGEAFGTNVDARIAHPLLELVAADGPSNTIEIEGADGRIYQATGRHVDDDSCSIDFLDVTERVEHQARLHRQARQDDLTGLLNRRGLLEVLHEQLRSEPDRSVSLLLLDLDDFKDVNDSLGHATGDLLLAHVARRIESCVMPRDTTARLGGDEFAVILHDAEDTTNRAHRLWECLNEPVDIGDLRLRVRASVGIASFPADACDPDELVRRADVAMYTAKSSRRGVVRYDPSADPYDRDHLALTADLEGAIESGELVLHHQPVVDVRTGALIGTEALVRWQHPRLGLVPPVQFIELAEVSGLIRPLTRWVVRQALSDLVALDLHPERDFKVSVNLSVRNLYEHDLTDWFRATLDEFGVPANRLVVEITESMIMDDPVAATDAIAGLRGLGIRTWIDDFGTGHSSFARLRTLPVDGVKIDRSFVMGATESPADRIVLRSIIELVASLGLTSIAEGVEDQERLDLLRSLGCDLAQGYHIARPMPFAQLTELTRAAVQPLASVVRAA